MSTAQVQDFCKACVLTGEATQDECDVSMMRRPARDTRARRRPAAPSPAAAAPASAAARNESPRAPRRSRARRRPRAPPRFMDDAPWAAIEKPVGV